jgi:thioesterase domain-containing protein
LLDTACPTLDGGEPPDVFGPHRLRRHLRRMVALGVRASGPYLADCLRRVAQRGGTRLRTRLTNVIRPAREAGPRRSTSTDPRGTPLPPIYLPRPYPFRLTLFLAADSPGDRERSVEAGWRGVATGGCEVRRVPGDHTVMLRAQNGKALAQTLDDCLRRAQRLDATVIGS